MTNTSSRKSRILHLISGDLWAGAEVMAFNLLTSLTTFPDLEIKVILLNEGRLANDLRTCGLTVQIIDEKQHSFWQILQKIRASINDTRPDIIHSHRYKENLLAFLASKSCHPEVKLITTIHGLPEVSNIRPGLATRSKTAANFFLISKYFTKTVAVSDDIRNTLISRIGFSNKRIGVIHNGIHVQPSHSFSSRVVRPFIIGSSGRLFPVKDYPLMVEIARALSDLGYTDIRFELAGEGPERTLLERLIESYGLQSRFILRGHQDDMDSFYQGLDLYLNTSIHEGIPMTILEALAHGLPVIAPAVGGIVEIIDDGTEGFLVAGRDPWNYAVKCRQLHDDAELWARMSSASRQRAEQSFSAEKMAESYYLLYSKTSQFS